MAPVSGHPSRFSTVWKFRRRQSVVWKSRMQAIHDALPDLIMRMDDKGDFIDVLASKEDDLAAPREELVRSNLRDVLPPNVADLCLDAAEYVLRTGEIREIEYSLDVPSGGNQVFDARLVKSGPNEITAIIRNITERRRLQEQSEARNVALTLERERRIILERFLQNASHDLRTPLTALMTGSYLIDRYVSQLRTNFQTLIDAFHAGDEPQRQIEMFLDMVRRLDERQKMLSTSSERLKTLVDAMFDMIWLDSEGELPLEPGHLDAIAQAVLHMYKDEADAQGVALTYETIDTALVLLHGEMMQRAIQHIVRNALNFTPAGGSVALSLRVEDGFVILDVADTGVGIAAEHIQNIFERFYRVDEARPTQTGGSGLGLSIALRIVHLHGGRIDVESETGRGSTFRIMLPCLVTA